MTFGDRTLEQLLADLRTSDATTVRTIVTVGSADGCPAIYRACSPTVNMQITAEEAQTLRLAGAVRWKRATRLTPFDVAD